MPPNPESEKVASDPGYLSDPFRTFETITSGIHKNDSPVTERITTTSATTVEDTATTGSSGHGFAVPISLVLFGYLNYTVLFVISYIKELLYGLGPWRGKHIGMLKEGAFRYEFRSLLLPILKQICWRERSLKSFYIRPHPLPPHRTLTFI